MFYIVWFILFLLPIRQIDCTACKNILDYLQPNLNSNCFDDPDEFLDTVSLLKRYSKNYEEHFVVTEDGYILKVFRILPKKLPAPVTVLLHAATTDSVVWVGQRNDSLAFILHNMGYDVWLPNNRGTSNSVNHTKLSSNDVKFWDYSFHEIAIYDYSAIFKYIKLKTNSDGLIGIGHSMAGTSAPIYASLKSEEAKQLVRLLILMAPVTYIKNIRSPTKYLAPFEPLLRNFFYDIGRPNVLQFDSIEGFLFRLSVINRYKVIPLIWESLVFGWTPAQIQSDLINLHFSQNPRGLSVKTLFHYLQQINAGGNFVMYDYGTTKNMKLYQSITPPEYPIGNLSVPVVILSSTDDTMATSEDADYLYNKIPEKYRYGNIVFDGINHVNFNYGKDRREKIIDPILEILERMT